ncbi:MAG: DUF2330 domain-containing protein [Chloroflexota bacterium]
MLKKQNVWFVIMLLAGAFFLTPHSALACGGLFCQNSPVDQNAEKIIFTQNNDGTVSAIIQIQYTGFAEDFSWILPLPEAIDENGLAVPETAMTAFTELEVNTNPVIIAPPLPDCAAEVMMMESAAMEEMEEAVEVFASGEVGPFGFDVIGSEDPEALITWLRDNNYRVEPPMEPLINVYVEEQFVFLAMKLLPQQGVQDIQPIQVTYPAEKPMIPLRLTAVAANPDMAVLTWFFAEEQAVPENFAHMEIADEEITFFDFGGNNYRQLMGEKADSFDGQAFITEFAGPSNEIVWTDPLLQDLAGQHSYLTRLNTVLSPEEMTVDPVFTYDGSRANVFNVRDLSNMTGLYECEREQAGQGIINQVFGGNNNNSGNNNNNASSTSVQQGSNDGFTTGLLVGGGIVLTIIVLLGAGFLLGRRSNN